MLVGSLIRLVCVSALLVSAICCQSVDAWDDGRAWGDAEQISDSIEAWRPDVAVDPNGRAVAVWDDPAALLGREEPPGRPEDIWSSRYTPPPNSGWAEPELLEINDTDAANFPRVAMDGDGNAVVVWHQKNGSRQDIWSSRYTQANGWSTTELIEEEDNGSARRPEIAMSSDGDAVAVWYQFDGTHDDIWSNRYSEGAWGEAERIERIDGNARWPQVAIDPSGRAIAVWQQTDALTGRFDIYSNRSTSTGVWSQQTPVENDDAGDATRPHVAVDAGGNAVVVWQQSDGTLENVWSNRYSEDAWGAAELLEHADRGDALRPRVAMDHEGNAVAVWSQFDGTSDGIWSSRYAVTREDWGVVMRLDGNDSEGSTRPRVAMDAGGSAVVLWTQPHGTQPSIWSNRYTPSLGWGVSELIEFHDGGRAVWPEVAMDPNGEAVAVWSQRVGAKDEIYSNRLEWRLSE